MKKIAYLAVLALTGCAQTMTMFPRGGGQPIAGDLRTAEQTMAVVIDGERYFGNFTRGTATSVGSFTSFSGTRRTTGTAIGTSFSNSYSALLSSPSGKAMRCEFIGGLMEHGNGICEHADGRLFDLQLTP